MIDNIKVRLAEAKGIQLYDWININTAPTDGTVIFCAAIGHSDWYNFETHKIIFDDRLRVWWHAIGRYSAEFHKFWDGVEPAGFANLSHWHPLEHK